MLREHSTFPRQDDSLLFLLRQLGKLETEDELVNKAIPRTRKLGIAKAAVLELLPGLLIKLAVEKEVGS